MRTDHHADTTWAPVGRIPVRSTGGRHVVNMISAITAQGALRFAVFDGSLDAKRFIEFCNRLMHDTDGPVYLVLDGHPAHRARVTKRFADATHGQLRLSFLPGYSPEINPDGWVRKNVKHDRVGKAGTTGADDLKTKALGALRRLQKLPQLVRAFFPRPHCVLMRPGNGGILLNQGGA
ncbi:transposase [Amycolatopsis pigmentata]|uniref:Transposase n=1 Tax=Amycolatopsis pigmentata TaxID=450801 RepID=A0ABW5FZP6_9PSEU